MAQLLSFTLNQVVVGIYSFEGNNDIFLKTCLFDPTMGLEFS